MPLTPEDVRNKLFTTVRLREGYEQAEVDEFLDEVEAELLRLLKENDELRQRLAEASEGGPVAVAPTPQADSQAEAQAESQPEPQAEPAAAPVAAAAVAAAPAAQQIVVRSSEDVGAAATKVLQMAQRTADQVVAEAKADADQMLAEAKDKSDRMTTEAKQKADQLDRETRERTTALEAQLDEQRRTALGKLETERNRLVREGESLRAFEREYRGRLRSFLEGQLNQLNSRGGDDTPLAPAANPAYAGSHGTDAGPETVQSSYGTAGTADSGPTDDAREPSALGRILAEEEQKAEGEHQ